MAETAPSPEAIAEPACPAIPAEPCECEAAAPAAPGEPEASGAKPPKPFASYALSKCIVGYGIINGIINAAIFAAMHGDASNALFSFKAVAHDMALTGALLGMLLFVIVVPLTKADFRKGRFSGPGETGQLAPLPRSFALATVAMGVIGLVAAVGVAEALCLMLPLPLDVSEMMLLKGTCCAMVGCLSGYFTISWVVRASQDR